MRVESDFRIPKSPSDWSYSGSSGSMHKSPSISFCSNGKSCNPVESSHFIVQITYKHSHFVMKYTAHHSETFPRSWSLFVVPNKSPSRFREAIFESINLHFCIRRLITDVQIYFQNKILFLSCDRLPDSTTRWRRKAKRMRISKRREKVQETSDKKMKRKEQTKPESNEVISQSRHQSSGTMNSPEFQRWGTMDSSHL
jgi:hypothetical protein